MKEPAPLRPATLSFAEVLAASIALIGLTMTPVLVAPYMYANAGNATWVAYAFGGAMLIFVALNLNQFTRRSSAAGSMYGYAANNLGRNGGAFAGWSLIWAYLFVGAAEFGAMALFATQLFGTGSTAIAEVLTILVVAGVCFYLSLRDIGLSTIMMLVFETASVAIICLLIAIVFFHHGPSVDVDQLRLRGFNGSTIGLGIATAVFSLVGFESATAFGEEAHQPLIIIPRAVIWSIIIASLFFIVATYAEIMGLRASRTPLDKLTAPLSTLAQLLHIGYLGLFITLGAFFSAFSVALACVNTCARIVLAMAREGALPPSIGAVHSRYRTPHISLVLTTGGMLAIVGVMALLHLSPLDMFNYGGTLSAFGFITIYALIAIAAPRYLYRIGEMRRCDVLLSAITIGLMLVPTVTFFYPPQTPPAKWFPYFFVAYLAVGWVAFTIFAKNRRVVNG
ncbi:MAG: APC family permease [Candidatus Eremiobacteraeota bacterium]|nr:APC family permease [Candidatus Eremiobacteraeota bacterium]